MTKIAIVTGGSSGIGKDVAAQLSTNGYKVMSFHEKVSAKTASNIVQLMLQMKNSFKKL